MNEELKRHAREKILEGLEKLPESNQQFFIRIFSHEDRTITIEQAVDKVPDDKLDGAMTLVERSIAKMENAND